MKKKSKVGCIVGILVAGAAFVLVVVVVLAVGVQAYQDTPRQVSDFDFGVPVPNAYKLSGQQIELIQRDGYPQSFSILFYQERDENDKIETIRSEEWAYPILGRLVVFENGTLVSVTETERLSTQGTAYRPEAFTAFINRKQVAAAGGIDEWMIVPVEKELVADADLYYAEGLTFGLKGGDLVFIEALGFESDQPLPDLPEDPAAQTPADGLTPEESAAQGEYLYSAIYFEDGTLIGCGELPVEFSFEDDALIMAEWDEAQELSRVAENTFISNAEDLPIALLFTPTGYNWSAIEGGITIEFHAFRKLSDETQVISNAALSDEERLNQGTHTYQVDFCQADEVSDTSQITLTITFPEGTAEMVESAGPDIFLRLGENLYLDDEEQDFEMIFTNFGFIWRVDEGTDEFVVFTIQE